MGYLHISNLYRNQTIMLFKEAFALEKCHGTSSHIYWDGKKLSFFSGGENYDNFVALFDVPALTSQFAEKYTEIPITIYGEAYGGKQQGMSATYGKKLCFIVFDVKIRDTWLEVPNAEAVAISFGLEFIPYEKVPATIEALDAERDKPSVIAVRRGILEPKMREGVVLRPILEMVDKHGERIIAKHKGEHFNERQHVPKGDAKIWQVLEDARAIADEWVVPMRMTHVLDKIGNPKDLSATGSVIAAMVEDVLREAKDEIVDTKDVRRAIGAAAAKMFKARVCKLE